jgi:hypothetical protein
MSFVKLALPAVVLLGGFLFCTTVTRDTPAYAAGDRRLATTVTQWRPAKMPRRPKISQASISKSTSRLRDTRSRLRDYAQARGWLRHATRYAMVQVLELGGFK